MTLSNKQTELDFKKLVQDYLSIYPDESKQLSLAKEQISTGEDMTSRKNFVGHFTASVYLYCLTTKRVLLLKHKALGKFLQPGGHIDNNESPFESAKRELFEETGIIIESVNYRPIAPYDIQIPFDINTHFIPENKNKNEESHYHHDMGYLMVTNQELNVQLENNGAKEFAWVDWDTFRLNNDFKKVAKKVELIISNRSPVYLYNEVLNPQTIKVNNYRCIVVQHIIPNSYEFLMHLHRIFGKNLTVLAKPKSINDDTLAKLKSKGLIILISKRDNNFLKDILKESKQKSLILDIGGYFADLSTIKNLPILGIIEDTENGYKKYISNATKVNYPFISVSRSPLKDNEDRLVGESIVQSTDLILREINILVDYCKCAVIGYGKIGRGICGLLQKRNVRPYVVEQDKVKLVKAVNEYCYATSLEEAVATSKIIFCATGNGVISIGDFRKIRNGSYVVSVTSSDDEFDTKYLGTEYKKQKITEFVTKFYSDNNYFYLLNEGNAVNFIHSPALGNFIYLVLSEIITITGYIVENNKKLKKGEIEIQNLQAIRDKIAESWLKEFVVR